MTLEIFDPLSSILWMENKTENNWSQNVNSFDVNAFSLSINRWHVHWIIPFQPNKRKQRQPKKFDYVRFLLFSEAPRFIFRRF